MQWGKIKNILIVLFLILNLFLLYNYIGLKQAQGDSINEINQNLVQILAQKGVQIYPTLLPKREEAYKSINLTTSEAGLQNQIRILLGDYEKNDLGAANMQYISAAGQITIKTDGTFNGQLNSFDIVTIKNAFGIDAEIAFEQQILQYVNKKPVYNCFLTITQDQENKIFIFGRWIFGQTSFEQKEEGNNFWNNILSFVVLAQEQTQISQIQDIQVGYLADPGAAQVVAANAALEILADGKKYYFDIAKQEIVLK